MINVLETLNVWSKHYVWSLYQNTNCADIHNTVTSHLYAKYGNYSLVLLFLNGNFLFFNHRIYKPNIILHKVVQKNNYRTSFITFLEPYYGACLGMKHDPPLLLSIMKVDFSNDRIKTNYRKMNVNMHVH